MNQNETLKQKIQYAGINKLNESERAKMKTIIAQEFDKIEKMVQEPIQLHLHIKTSDVTGTRKRIHFQGKLVSPSMKIVLDESEGKTTRLAHWDVAEATHRTMKYFTGQVRTQTKARGQGREWRRKIFSNFFWKPRGKK